MSVSSPSALTSLTPKSSRLTAKPAEIKTPEEKFLEYAKMTPAERMHAAMLSQLGITEDQFKAMDSAAQQEIEDKIREMIRQQAENGGDKRAGLITDKTSERGSRPSGFSNDQARSPSAAPSPAEWEKSRKARTFSGSRPPPT